MSNWQDKYVGLPFLDHGRDFKGIDCWGLIRLVMREECSIDVPSYGDTSALDLAKVAGLVKSESAIEPWTLVHPLARQAFDVVVMHRRHDPVHVGIMASHDTVLHIEEKIAAVMIPIDHPTIVFRNPKFYRHRDLISHAA